MLASLKALISDLAGETDGRDRFEDNDFRIAVAALLVRAASVDSDISRARCDKIHAVLKSYFGSDDTSTAKLVKEAAKAVRQSVDLYHFTRRINQSVDDDEGPRRIVQMMWEVIHADDGGASPLEGNMVWRAADLLGVPSRQRIELQRIAREGALLSEAPETNNRPETARPEIYGASLPNRHDMQDRALRYERGGNHDVPSLSS
jgi:uncharacterized tellurite resistance protein B-like protein